MISATTRVIPIATATGVLIPSTEPETNSCRVEVVVAVVPLETCRLTPYSSAFMPRVVTIAVIPIRLTMVPAIRPATIAQP